ncbi:MULTISPECIES: penicillin-binding protein activator LpoB [Providencia]|uniref:penicillin-binding protein activator LpoB n=1 Tax=Providencia TaxID=586 RepID=UPI000EF914E9|nr:MULTISPECIES: penicillin-binding protein activator LpoB [Providencia]EMF0916322.1 penicillin-binding protein activator LpoB [Providencia stuartii]MCR4078661.1 penicillin-binding protein activator LpoB [Providencia stuartii]RMA17420.1 penicillin-binding protein activator LpoB [Providencia stuartii]
MKRILFVAAAAMMLAGCPSFQQDRPKTPPPVVPVEPTEPTEPTTPPPIDKVPTPPKQKTTDWSAAVSPLVGQMTGANGVESGKVLLVDSVKNNTTGSFSVQNVTSAIVKAVDDSHRFKVVPQYVVNAARRTLGLSQDDSLVTRSKAIGLGRYVQADYVLYSVISGSNDQRDIEMQLMAVQSGEILWSGKNDIEQ